LVTYVLLGSTVESSLSCPQSVFTWFLCLSEQSLFPCTHELTGFYNHVGVCLLRGTN